jgi:hypothetical protein
MLATCGSPLRHFGWTLLLCGFAPMAYAQGTQSPGKQDVAVLTLSALTAVDFNGESEAPVDVRDAQFRGVEPYSAVSASVLVNPLTEKFHWQVNASTGVRHYTSLQEFVPTGQNVNGSLSFSFGGRTTVNASGYASYAPTYGLGPVLPRLSTSTDVSPAALDYGAVASPSVNTTTNLSITQALNTRTDVSVSYAASRTIFSDSGGPDLTSTNASARLTYRFSKYGSVHAGYGRRLGLYNYVSAFAVREQHVDDIDVGVDYNRALTVRTSRRTMLNFGTGSSIYSDFFGRHFSATGSANLMHRFGRSGEFGISYVRGVGFVEGLLTPVITDTANATTASSLSRRVRLYTSLGYTYGNGFNTIQSLGGVSNSYGAWTGIGQFSFTLTRRTSLQAGYLFYQHNVDNGLEAIINLPSHQRRQTLFVNLSYGLPLYTQRVPTRR